MTLIPTTIREELANLRALAKGIEDGCAAIEALLPVDPPPPVLPVAQISVSQSEITSDTDTAELVVSLSVATDKDVVVHLGFTGTAVRGVHYDIDETITIQAGFTGITVPIVLRQLPDFGDDREATFAILSADGATFDAGRTVSIGFRNPVEPPPPEPIHVSLWADADKLAMPESGGEVQLVVNLSRPAEAPLWIPLVFSGDATYGTDYDCLPSVLIEAGKQSGFVIVKSLNDDIDEANETIVIAIEPSDAYVIDQGSVLITITDDDEPPPPPPPPPDPNPPAYTVRAAHPRMYLLDEQIPEAQARLKAAPAVLTALIKQADAESTASNGPFDRTLSCAILWRLGLGRDAGIKSKYTNSEYWYRAIDNLIRLCANPINLAGNHFDLNHLEPLAWARDWLWNELSEEHRALTLKPIVDALEATWGGKVANDRIHTGYNGHSGMGGMLLALSIHGETEIDWVARYWSENWWQEPPPVKGGLWNRQFEKMLNGPGNNEDWLYMNNHAGLFACRHAWETATGDTKSLDIPWFTEFTLLHLHQGQADPIVNAAGVQTGSRLRMLPTSCAGGGYTTAGQAHIFKGETGAGGWRAALGAYMVKQADHATRPAAEEFLFRVVIGDPRVKPQSPAELGLPLNYVSGRTGFVYSRASWERNAPCMRFACSEFAYRATGVGDFSIWAGGLPLICHRSNLYDHGYAGLGRLTLPQILDTTTGKLISAVSGDGTRRNEPIASLTHTDDGWHIADLSRLWGKAVSLMLRSVLPVWDSETSGTITVVDECVCRDGFVPVSTWGTPLEPMVGIDTVTFSNGTNVAIMDFEGYVLRLPEIKVLGGEGTEAGRDLDGTIYNEKGLATWLKLSRDGQIAAGGYYTVYTFPTQGAHGVWRLVTTIRVSL